MTNYIKPTAITRTFLNGNSFHPISVFQSIIVGEAIRMRRLNEKNHLYEKSIKELEEKCFRSKFNSTIVKKNIDKVKSWIYKEDTEKIDQKNKNNTKRITWSTQFKNLLKLDKREKELSPNASITFCKPPNLGMHLLNYKRLTQTKKQNNYISTKNNKCMHCKLCGNFGNSKCMVLNKEKLINNKGKCYKLNMSLNCKNYGIYGAECLICKDIYVGQTKNKFSTRWSSHRSIWNKLCTNVQNGKKEMEEDLSDEKALFRHYVLKHSEVLKNHMYLSDAYGVFFIEQPRYEDLDIKENVWIGNLDAKINISRTFLPKYK